MTKTTAPYAPKHARDCVRRASGLVLTPRSERDRSKQANHVEISVESYRYSHFSHGAVSPHREAYNTSMATVSYLDRLLEPLTEAFTPRMASVLLELRADSELEVHIDELRRKANSGTLTPAEEAEYKDFVEAVDLISIMQAKARRFLAKQSA